MDLTEADQRPRRTSVGKRLLFSVLLGLLALVLLEGLVSLGLFAFDALSSVNLARTAHTGFDAALGWVNRPSVVARDLYGAGRDVSINARGFRATTELAATVPTGRCRVIASGDSFTFGYGVDDDDTWVHQLERLQPRLEMVNMGQGGYGVDQAYLWYLRDGAPLEHQVHLFAIVLDDLKRMESDTFVGYAKPTLRIEAGVPVAHGVPVRRRSPVAAWLEGNPEIPRSLRLVQLGGRLAGDWQPRRELTTDEALRIAFEAMLALQRLHQAAGRQFVFILLPTGGDYRVDASEPLRQRFVAELRQRGIAAIELVSDLRTLPERQLPQVFIAPGEVPFHGAAGHYTAEGNRLIAARLLTKLQEIPGFAECGAGHP